MKNKLFLGTILASTLFFVGPVALAEGYTEIYNAPPTGVAVRSFLPFKMHYDESGQYLLTVLYVDQPIQEAPTQEAPQEPRARFAVPFAFNSSSLTRSADAVIRQAAESVGDSGRPVVIGRADMIGASDYNQALSQRRADAVVRQLVHYGVSAEQIQETAVGQTAPSADCANIRQRTQRIRCEAPNRATLIHVY